MKWHGNPALDILFNSSTNSSRTFQGRRTPRLNDEGEGVNKVAEVKCGACVSAARVPQRTGLPFKDDSPQQTTDLLQFATRTSESSLSYKRERVRVPKELEDKQAHNTATTSQP